jgi:predicted GTPase
MQNKKIYYILLGAVVVACLSTILVFNHTDFVKEWTFEQKALTKQYLKMFGFMAILGIVFVRFQKRKEE